MVLSWLSLVRGSVGWIFVGFNEGEAVRGAPERVRRLRPYEVHAGAIFSPPVGRSGNPIVTLDPVAVGVVPVNPPHVVGSRAHESNHGLSREDDLVVVVDLREVLLFGGPRFTDHEHPRPGAVVVKTPTARFDERHLTAALATDGRQVDAIRAGGGRGYKPVAPGSFAP